MMDSFVYDVTSVRLKLVGFRRTNRKITFSYWAAFLNG